MGGIVGLAQNSTVQYCANTGNMTSWAPCTGGIVGQLYQGSKIINCYSTGEMVPLGKGTTDFGGIAGTVGAGTEIRHCYFAGEMDLSQYTATTPYKRLGGIAGGVSSDTPVFENNYFVQTENVPACFKYQDAGTEKTLDFMKTEDFFNEITTAGGNYRLNSNGTPILPAPKYAVSFVVTPTELTNVIIKVNGQEVTNPVDLEAGTYPVEVSADNCKVFNSSITITADTATHTQTIAMTYLPADYTKVDEAIAKANALNKDNYKDFSAVETAVNAVVRDKNITDQSEVDAMANAIEDAIAALQYKDADYTKVDAALAKANALKKDDYKDFSAVETAVNAVARGKNITEQAEVDAMAKAIEDAIAALQYKDADYTRVDAAIARANALNKNDYKDFSGVECAIRAVARGKNITQQAEVDAMAKAIEDALAALQYKDANKTTQPTPAPAATATPQYTIPQTGDTSNPALLVVLMLVSGSAAIGTAVVASKKKHNR